MPIPWLTVLGSVPWGEVMKNAPKVAEGAKKLWNSVGKHTPAEEAPAAEPSQAPHAFEDPAVAALQARLASTEAAVAELREQMLASSGLIKTLAEQNTRLIERAEANRVRVVWLGVAVGVLGILAVVGLGLAFLR